MLEVDLLQVIFVYCLLRMSGLEPFGTFYGLYLEFHGRVLLAAYFASIGIFNDFMPTNNLITVPSHAMHHSAMVSTALGTNLDVFG